MIRGAILGGAALVLLYMSISSLPAFGQSGEVSVTATVRLAAACLTVSPTTVDFGTLELAQPGAVSQAIAPPAATATVSLRNCSTQSETVLVKGGPAAASGVTWAHAPGTNVCAGPNLFAQGVRDAARNERLLTSIEQTLTTLPAGATEPVTLTLTPPCAGSAGAGQTITVKYTFTAMLAGQGPR